MPLLNIQPVPFADWGIGIDRPLIIAGPCSAESREQVLATAEGIVEHAPQVKVFRAGVWKPRTRPGGFEGAGEAALPWLAEARERTGLLTMVEVATPQHVEAALKGGVDMLWIGARTTPNPFSVQAIADALSGTDIPIFVKNPVNPDLQLWIGALERLFAAGLTRVAAIHRGFHWFERTPYRNSPMWEIPVRLKAAFPDLELLCDPSHIAGNRELLAGVAQQALDLNFSGLMIETHIDPEAAKSDADQQVRPQDLATLLNGSTYRRSTAGPDLRDELQEHRDLIDRLDEEILQKVAARMEISERIGLFKQAHNIAILQPERWRYIMRAAQAMGTELGHSQHFIQALMDAVHDESIRKQTAVWEREQLAAGYQGSSENGIASPDIGHGSA
ncbi:MAG: bifunctional 3-deoxy-7-phosphoheptulonate synthase/chorismate mutase type II [Flavobacteriales bacterium]|nr:bifunctional 3-deoxy-7-phosphoheptulonate synthase/chorismate mutase type II [Flavobacteriales bacterium]MBK6892064.1 bifunctional 3-deoxy-7-phosphoheptulonate synthase/chorismate mutase type II [Flavobacteriales bacterium]MBK7246199.1 bifunctional 3-deoxy-7-phosphoheptulonate synthase/chorismate mutase type II [Flavobacteriales bacterium]MBK9060036.1 bifunctional 3-deoxy-7-phosphoheptulonate synthase/chorismate mutase type II [Flavobacteriales bacterium]QQS71899.1 MAG: bifunctional 3-deoxy-